ncbi:MAG: hypothetical protein K6E64_00935 [Lachnospiraceae bacterium]|nr:hypothetical protein [Lachnospiraceae bacterium]
MKKAKQILAILGIVLLVGLYVMTFVFAIIDNPNTLRLLGASICATIIIPAGIWIIGIFIRLSSSSKEPDHNTEQNGN